MQRDESAAEREAFWKNTAIPVNENWKQDKTDFVNAVTVSDMFARNTGVATRLASQAEELTDEIVQMEEALDISKSALTRLRRTLLSEHFGEIKASWNAEIIEAFILKIAGPRTEELLSHERDIEKQERELAPKKALLEKLTKRLKMIEKTMEMAKQYLDYDKLLQRLQPRGGRPF